MARKESTDAKSEHGLGDIIGIVLVSVALLLLVALLSYDRNDLAFNHLPPNHPERNWIGPVGSHTGYAIFFVCGAAAYFVPALLLIFGLANFFQPLAYLRRCKRWAAVLLFAFMGMLDLYSNYFSGMKAHLDSGSAGGFVGLTMNHLVFDYFGQIGATIIFVTLYVISLIYLTNFHLMAWLRGLHWPSFTSSATSDAAATAEEKALERRARELGKQAKQLQDQLEKSSNGSRAEAPAPNEPSGLGADMQPVPEPTVRDLSVPPPRSAESVAKAGRAKAKPEPKPEPEPTPEQMFAVEEVIPASEITAASTADIIGRPSEARPPEPKSGGQPDENPVAADAAAEKPAAEEAPPSLPVIPTPKPRPAPRKPKSISVASTPTIGNYSFPSVDLLNHADTSVKPTESKEELMANARLMQQTLAQFDIEVQLGDITKGPTITRYELHPAPGVKLEKISALSNNIAAALKAERIHILAPVPGKSSVGVEVPNLVKTKVIMRDLLESDEWINSKARIPLALGKDVYGHPIVCDLAEMPHVLIAGSTGSGKSVCINAIIASLLYKFSPDQLRFVMIDPKVVELQQYNALPHLVVPVVNDPKKVILALRWVVNEMEKRYQIFAKVGVRNIKSFNERPKGKPVPPSEPELPLMAKKEKIEAGSDGFAVEVDEEIVVPRDDEIVIPEKLSYVVVIIDELADLMLVAPADVEMAIARITQMARAAGIHCIVATQRPSVDVITGVIKANIPARIAFQVAAKVDSRTILDAMGADKLLGKGDMLYLPPGSAKLTRVQGVLITDQEIQDVVDHISKQGKPSYEVEIHKQLSKPAASYGDESGIDEDEELIQQCIEVIRSEQKASVSLMQRRLRLGYTRAARIMDELENRGIVGPSKGAEPRDILIDLDGGGADGAGE